MALPSTDPSASPPAPMPPPASTSLPASPAAVASGIGGGLSPGILSVLRQIVTSADFRAKFAVDPVYAITSADITITGDDLAKLKSLTANQLEQIAQGISVLTNSTAAAASAAGLVRKADGTHTLIWAIVVAVLLAAQAKQ